MPGNDGQLRHQERSRLDRPRSLQRQLEKKPFPLSPLRAVPGKMTPNVCDRLMFNAHRAWHLTRARRFKFEEEDIIWTDATKWHRSKHVQVLP
jgi:hypothetical protein